MTTTPQPWRCPVCSPIKQSRLRLSPDVPRWAAVNIIASMLVEHRGYRPAGAVPEAERLLTAAIERGAA